VTEEQWPRVKALFQTVVEQPPEERDAFLAAAIGDDAALRREVESLLASDTSDADFLDQLPVASESLLADPLATLEASMDPTRSHTVLAAGHRVGPYEIVAPLGAGAMGEVYRARDTKLHRIVALKVLPERFALDPDRLARFTREAQLLATLNHPNIGAIYGLEELSGAQALVLELVDGQTLAERTARGPIPLEEALTIARQIAEAVEAAHEKGIIHRDLKPANIKVTPDGRVKVLDFGLAKAVWDAEDARSHSADRAVSGLVTMAGQIIGSPAYMSPEQARGDVVDARTDIWAFGCLLYELLTGKQAFHEEDLQSTIAAVLERTPDWTVLPDDTPASIRGLLQHCLRKNVAERLQSIGDVRQTIERTRGGLDRWKMAAAAAAAFAALAVGGAIWPRGASPLPNRSEWVQLTNLDSVSQPALSPDGRMVAFIRGPATFFGPGEVYVKRLPDGEPVQLTNDKQAKMRPVFSADGTQIAYTIVGPKFLWDTWLVPALGGKPQRWLENASGLVWTGAGDVMFAEIRKPPHMGIVASDERRMRQRDVYLPAHEHAMAHLSYASPDGKWVLIVEMDADHAWMPCRLQSLDGRGAAHRVGPAKAACTAGAWSSDGKWMYVTSDAGGVNHIWRQKFPDGEPEQVTFGPTAEEGIAMAPDGRSFVTAAALQNAAIWLHDARGERQISPLERIAANPKFTADAKKLCYTVVKQIPTPFSPQRGEVWVADLESGRSQALAPGFLALDYDISADGAEIVMDALDADGNRRLWLAALDRRTPPRPIPNSERARQPVFSPDGDILFRRSAATTNFVYRMHPDGSGERRALDAPIALLWGVTRDGRWILAWAFLPDKGMALQAFPLTGQSPVLIAPNGIVDWSPGGNSIALSAGPIADNRSYIVRLNPGEPLPTIPAEGFRSEEDIARLPGAQRIDARAVPGPTSDVYAFYRGTTQRNLYRIPLQ
jgi:eukaryotic-like serine/threonine-protein kinase